MLKRRDTQEKLLKGGYLEGVKQAKHNLLGAWHHLLVEVEPLYGDPRARATRRKQLALAAVRM
jgi:hypothetical protein